MSFRPFWVLPLSLLLLGCPPKIGNKCTLSTDCSQLGDRLCDGTQPDGYCTIFNCEPDNCPNSVCVAFDPSLDPACQNADQGRWPRFERTFCLSACSSDSDCRDQYTCIDLSLQANQVRRRAQVVDVYANDGGFGYGVCMVQTCTDFLQDGLETDVDCGGGICGGCESGRKCAFDTDCKAFLASDGGVGTGCTEKKVCGGACTDGVKNNAETDVDCGGGCPKCALGLGCAVAADCESGICESGACQAGGIPSVCQPFLGFDGGVPWTPADGGP